jgi:hypothetical protein
MARTANAGTLASCCCRRQLPSAGIC